VIAEAALQAGAGLWCVFCEDGDVPALLELIRVARVFKAQPAQAMRRVIHAMAVKVDDCIRLAVTAGAIQFLAQVR